MLITGALAVLLGVLLCGSALLAAPSSRGQVGRQVSAIAGLSLGQAGPVRSADDSFVDRVLDPGFRRLAHLARRLSPVGSVDKLTYQLDLAGNPPGWTHERVYGAKGVGLVVGGLLGALETVHHPLLLLVVTPAAAGIGFLLPNVLLYNKGEKREQAIRRTLPDALDLLTISVEAGLGFDGALSQVARNTDGPLAGEFFRVLQEMQIGKSRAEAFRGLGARTRLPEVRGFVTAITQADGFGIPVGDVLREQAAEMRVKRRQRAEEKAQKVPVKILFPLVLFILPALFVVILGPGGIGIYHAFVK